MQLLMQFNASGVTVLLATHDEGLLNTFKFPRLVLQQGQLQQAPHSRNIQREFDSDQPMKKAPSVGRRLIRDRTH